MTILKRASRFSVKCSSLKEDPTHKLSLNTHPISPFVTNNHQSWFWLNKFIEQFSKLKKKYIFGPKKTKNGELYGISLLVSYVRFSIFQSQPKELQLLKRQFCPACHAKLSPHNVVQIVFGLKSNAHHFYTEQVQICVVCVGDVGRLFSPFNLYNQSKE